MSSAPLPNYLRSHRRRVGLSQGEVAFLLGFQSGTNVSRHEACRRVPDLETAMSYELILGVSGRELFTSVALAASAGVRRRAIRLLGKIARQEMTPKAEQKLFILRQLAR